MAYGLRAPGPWVMPADTASQPWSETPNRPRNQAAAVECSNPAGMEQLPLHLTCDSNAKLRRLARDGSELRRHPRLDFWGLGGAFLFAKAVASRDCGCQLVSL